MKKLNKLFAILVAMAMVLSLGVISAFAEGAPTADHAYITKNFQMPEGTTNPGDTFKFTILADKVNGDSTAVDLYDADHPLEVSMAGVQGTTDANGVTTYTKQIKNAFDNVPTKAGKYVYTVREVDEKASKDVEGQKTYTYSPDFYTVIAYREADGSLKFTAQKNTTDGSGKVPAQTDGETTYVDCAFLNKYVETKKVTPDGKEDDTNDKKGFEIQKKVDGAQADTDLDFTFNVTIDAPAISAQTGTPKYSYTIYTLGADGANGTPGATGTITANGEAQEIKLHHNQRAVFTDLEVGAKVAVTEPEVADWTTALNGTEGTRALAQTPVTTDSNIAANYVNTYTKGDSTPEGILISNLPYIALALVAIGGLVAYVVVRRRNADEA